jgi:uncharacterized protein YacL
MLFSALFFYLASVIITDFNELKLILIYSQFITLKMVAAYFIGFPSTIGLFSAISMFVIAFLFGSYIALAVYKTRQVKKFRDNPTLIGSAGIFLGILAPGCAACGLGLASLFGLSGFIVALPYHGLEISVLAFILLGYANYNLSKKVGVNTCAIKI